MNLVQARAVFCKELLDTSRDRRSLLAAGVFSLFGPLVLAAALLAAEGTAKEDAPLALAADGLERAPALAQFLTERQVEARPGATDLEAAVRRGEVAVALRLAGGFGERFAASRPARVEVLFDSARRDSRAAAERLRRLLAGYAARVGSDRLLLRGVSPSIASPLEIAERDFATPAARAAVALAALPVFLLMAAFVASMNAAIDSTAGERERGSLEPLLSQPLDPLALAVGKWAAAAVLSLLGVALTVLVTRQVLTAERLQDLGYHLPFGPRELLAFALLLLPLALLAPALQMWVALFSHNFKEAQTYLSLLLFVPLLPGFALSFAGREPPAWLGWVPLVGQQVLSAEVLRGRGVLVPALILAALTLLATVAVLLATARLFQHERILGAA